MRLHLGCGGVHLDGYTNVDVRPNAAQDETHDITRAWPWPVASCSEVLSYHVLEHLTRKQGEHYLRESMRVLRRGGQLVLELPDALRAAEEWVAGNAARASNLWGLQRNDYDYHKWGYTPETLSAQVEALGFGVHHLGPGTDYHAEQEPCFRLEATR